MTPGSSGSAVFRPPSRIGAAKFADRYMRTPYGRHDVGERRDLQRGTPASGSSALALTLLMTAPLMPIDAFARA